MEPLQIVATLDGGVSFDRPIMLDALLGYALILQSGRDPALTEADLIDLGALGLDRCVAKSACGRVYLTSAGAVSVEERELRYVHRRFPADVAQTPLGREMRRVNLSAGPAKSYRIPYERMHLRGDVMTWWCLGDADAIRPLLASITHLGRRRAVGNGRVVGWEVEPSETWDGFPCVVGGQPLRNLPVDWPGVAPGCEIAWATLAPPYWQRSAEVECYVPVRP